MADDRFDLADIDRCVRLARESQPITPFLHPNSETGELEPVYIWITEPSMVERILAEEWTAPPRRWRRDGVRMTKRAQKKAANRWMSKEAPRLRRLYPHLRTRSQRLKHHVVSILSSGVTGYYSNVRIVED
jgi:hypothetical protein